jgi:hypothetical protein
MRLASGSLPFMVGRRSGRMLLRLRVLSCPAAAALIALTPSPV